MTAQTIEAPMFTESSLYIASLKTNRTPKHNLPVAPKRGVALSGDTR